MTHINFLKKAIQEYEEELKTTPESDYKDYLKDRLGDYKEELREKESYQYLEDNNIQY